MGGRRYASLRHLVRILFLTLGYPPVVHHGLASSISSWAGALASKGHDVHILDCLSSHSPSDEEEHGVTVHRRPTLRGRVKRRVQDSPRPTVRLVNQASSNLSRGHLLTRLHQAASFYVEYRRLRCTFDLLVLYDMSFCFSFSLLDRTPRAGLIGAPEFLRARRDTHTLGLRARIADLHDRLGPRRADVLIAPSKYSVEVLQESGWLGQREVNIIPRDDRSVSMGLGRVRRKHSAHGSLRRQIGLGEGTGGADRGGGTAR